MAVGKRKTKETSTSGRRKRARIVSSEESADDGIDEGRAESENMLRQSASKKQETEWHVEMREQINQGQSELLKRLAAERKKIALQKNRRNQEIRALVKSINPSLFQPQTPGSKPHESHADSDDEIRALASVINNHQASDEHVRSLFEYSKNLFKLAGKLKSNYASTCAVIAKATFPASITGKIQEDRRRLLTALEHGRRVAEADIKTLTTGATTMKASEKKKRAKGKNMHEEVEVVEDPGMLKWRKLQTCLRSAPEGTGKDKENRVEGSAVKGHVEGKSVKGILTDACKGVEKMTRGLPEMIEVEEIE